MLSCDVIWGRKIILLRTNVDHLTMRGPTYEPTQHPHHITIHYEHPHLITLSFSSPPRDVSTPGDPFQYADSTNGADPDTPYVRGYSKNGVQGPGPDQRRREMKADGGGQMCFWFSRAGVRVRLLSDMSDCPTVRSDSLFHVRLFRTVGQIHLISLQWWHRRCLIWSGCSLHAFCALWTKNRSNQTTSVPSL